MMVKFLKNLKNEISSIKILILSSVFWVDCSFAEPTPWWEVSYNLDIQYPRMGDYTWEHNSEKLYLRVKEKTEGPFTKSILLLVIL